MGNDKAMERTLKRVHEMLAGHQVAIRTDTTLVFRKPDSGDCYLRYEIINERYLVVVGDLGEAIYLWSQPINFGWLSGLDLHYFMEKCQASEVGRDFRDWSMEEAKSTMARRLEHLEPAERKRAEKLLREDHGYSAMAHADEWRRWADDNFRVIFEDMDGMWDLGLVPHIRVVCHLEGLRLAMGNKR